MEENIEHRTENSTELTPEAREIIAIMDIQENKKKSPWAGIGALVVTLLLFTGTGLFSNSLQAIISIVVILFIHESGHFIAMKVAGYKDVNMFFLPFLGAAVSGRKTDVSSITKVIVSAAGPVPGIILGLVLGSFVQENSMLYYFALNSVFINGINLLPIVPLDGGRIAESLVFGRNKYMELAFNIVASVVLLLGAYLLKTYFLAIIAIPVLINIKSSFIASTIAKKFSRIPLSGRLPDQDPRVINFVVLEVLANYRDLMKDPRRINIVQNVWERITIKPPKASVTIMMLIAYLALLILTIFPLI